MVLADTFAHYADIGFAAANQGTPLTTSSRHGSRSPPTRCKIYFDFSGYSDMAIGLDPRTVNENACPSLELRIALQGDEYRRFLAPLAHHAQPFFRETTSILPWEAIDTVSCVAMQT